MGEDIDKVVTEWSALPLWVRQIAEMGIQETRARAKSDNARLGCDTALKLLRCAAELGTEVADTEPAPPREDMVSGLGDGSEAVTYEGDAVLLDGQTIGRIVLIEYDGVKEDAGPYPHPREPPACPASFCARDAGHAGAHSSLPDGLK